MSLEDEFVEMDELILSTRRALEGFGGSPVEFLVLSQDEFVRAAEVVPPGVVAVRRFALSVFLLARQQEVIEGLVADLRWRSDCLEFLGGLSDL